MANSFSASFEEIWAAEQQTVFYKQNVAMKVADISFNSTMRKGDTLNRTYRSAASIAAYVRGTDITITDATDTNEALTVNREFAGGFYVDDFDAIQDKYDIAANYGKDYGVALSNQIDSDVLGEVFNASSTIDDADVGGTAGEGALLTAANVIKIFTGAKKKMRLLNVTSNDLFAVITPEVEDFLTQYWSGRATDGGDTVNENGYIGRYQGFKLYSSNQTASSAVLALATQPTNTDPITIEGVTFTFVSSIGSTAGNVLIGANVDATRANLATLINAPATTTSTGVALSTANANLFAAKVTATNNDTANTLLVKYKGIGTITVTETLTDATDTWTAAKIKQHLLFGVVGNPVLVVQRKPTVVVREEPKKLGRNILNGVLYGVKTFVDNAKQMVNVEIDASTF